MAWTTKTDGRAKEFVVLKHRLNDMNGMLAGVKFRGGYGVVEKNTKIYFTLRQLPLLKGQPEFDLLHLRKLKFITRTQDVKLIFGQDVYYHYLKQLNPVLDVEVQVRVEKAEEEHTIIYHLCAFTTKAGSKCDIPAMLNSPAKYCKRHILEDKGIEALGIKLNTGRLTKMERKAFKDSVVAKLEKM